MWETLKIIRHMGDWKPQAVIWENVPNVLSRHMIHSFTKYLTQMERMGYVNNYASLNALDFGLPQDRKRIFTISILDGPSFDFTALEKLPMQPISRFLEHTDAPQYRVTQPSMLNRINGTTGPFRGKVPVITDKCMTITTKQMRCPNSGVIDTGDGYRYLTEKECWRLMGFHDEDYEAALAANPSRPNRMNGTLYKQAGNSIAVPILEAIFRQLLNPTQTNLTLF